MSLLPVRRRPAAGQCVTDWLEHVAEDNGMLTTQLDSMLRQAGATTRLLPVKPNPRTVTTISELTGAAASHIALATLARYDGTAVNLDGLISNRWSSWRNVAGRGWFRLRGTAACPKCLAETRMISPQEASALTGLSLREIYQRVEAGSLHFIETQQGQLYICTNSIDI